MQTMLLCLYPASNLDIKDPKESDFANLASDLRLMARAASIRPVLCNTSTLVSMCRDPIFN